MHNRQCIAGGRDAWSVAQSADGRDAWKVTQSAEGRDAWSVTQSAEPRSGSYDAIYADAVRDSKKELTDPIDFLKREYPNKSLFRFILTHPDLDHMRGLKRLHENIGFTNFWDTAHSKPTPKYRSDADREDWEFYQTLRSDAKNYTRGNSCFAFGKDENGVPGGDNIEILSPTPALVKSCNQSEKSNDLSLVLRVRHGAVAGLVGI